MKNRKTKSISSCTTAHKTPKQKLRQLEKKRKTYAFQRSYREPPKAAARSLSATLDHGNKVHLDNSLTIKFRVSLSCVCIPHGDETPLHSNRVVHSRPNAHAPIINISACTKKKTGVRHQLQQMCSMALLLAQCIQQNLLTLAGMVTSKDAN